MIQAKYLRIGNWVLADVGLPSLMSHQISCGDFGDLGTGKLTEDMISPILLTEEILLKCGFEKQDYNMSNCHVYQKGIYRVLKPFNNNNINQDYSLCINGISPPTWSIAHFKFVHQLQNLYFALTNTELEISL